MQRTSVRKVYEDEIKPDRADEAIIQAGEILKKGGLVAFPTETVYGLGANALSAEAAAKIYAAKGRPSDNPLIVHICCFEDIHAIVANVPRQARLLADAFWPGPLTMILQKSKIVPYETTGGMDTVAVRMPANRIALALIREGGGYIAAPSANTSGRPSPTEADHVYEDLNGKIPLILDGGEVGIGIESTIIDLTEQVPTILRPGFITQKMLSDVIGEVQTDPGMLAQDAKIKPKAPGMKYRHYAPRAEMILVEGTQEQVVKKISQLAEEMTAAGRQVGIIGTKETAGQYKQGVVFSIGSRQEEEEIAHNLYRILRSLDASGVDIIYAESFETPQIGQAIRNRLLKAAGHQVMKVK